MSDTLRFVIWVHRRPESLFGAASNPVIRNGALLFFDEEDCARAECDRLNAHLNSPHVYYTVQLAHPREADCEIRSHADRQPLKLHSFVPNGIVGPSRAARLGLIDEPSWPTQGSRGLG
jgi:hypothetical protein